MDLRHLQTFCVVIDTGGFTRAAERLFLAQSAVSQQIRQLEEALGTVLFERSAVGVRPTQSGEVLYRHARRLLAQAEVAKGEITALEHAQQGRVAVAVTEIGALVLTEMIGSFGIDHPDVAIAVFEGPVGEVLGRVRAGQADFGLAAMIGDAEQLTLETLGGVSARTRLGPPRFRVGSRPRRALLGGLRRGQHLPTDRGASLRFGWIPAARGLREQLGDVYRSGRRGRARSRGAAQCRGTRAARRADGGRSSIEWHRRLYSCAPPPPPTPSARWPRTRAGRGAPRSGDDVGGDALTGAVGELSPSAFTASSVIAADTVAEKIAGEG